MRVLKWQSAEGYHEGTLTAPLDIDLHCSIKPDPTGGYLAQAEFGLLFQSEGNFAVELEAKDWCETTAQKWLKKLMQDLDRYDSLFSSQ